MSESWSTPSDPDGAAAPAGPIEAGLSGPALLVEDSMLIAIDVADQLHELGLDPIHTATTVREAMAHLDRATPVLAVLDVDLGAETSHAVAERLGAMGVPFALTTGHGYDGEPVEGYPDVPVLRKPFGSGELQALVRRLGRT